MALQTAQKEPSHRGKDTAGPRASSKPRPKRTAWKIFGGVVAALVVAYLAFCYTLADDAITPQRLANENRPEQYGLKYEDVRFNSTEDNIPLNGWLMPGTSDRAIVMVHGIDSNRSGGKSLPEAKAFVERGYTVLLYDSRGSGDSGGTTHGLGWFERRDVQGAVNVLYSRGFKPGRIVLEGTSFGAATALLSTAAIPGVSAVIADSSWSDARELFDQEQKRKTGLPPLFTPGITFWFLARHHIDLSAITPLKALEGIKPRPILLIHGTADTRIPVSHSYRLKAAAPEANVELWIVEGAEHAKAYDANPAAYLARVTGFFDKALN